MSRQHAVVESAASKENQERVWDAFRRWGYLQADLDPLGDLQPVAIAILFSLNIVRVWSGMEHLPPRIERH